MAWLVVGLGNPGSKYQRNRHNIGFMVVDELARAASFSAWRSGAIKGAETTSGMVGRAKCVLVKPQEFMNLSGFAVQRALAFHAIAIDKLLVVHDEIDLDFGVVRLKQGGGHGGHNGLRSILEQLGTKEGAGFARLRMGVGRDPNKPPGSKDAANWVLGDFPKAQEALLAAVISAGCEDIATVADQGIGAAMNQHNSRSSLTPA